METIYKPYSNVKITAKKKIIDNYAKGIGYKCPHCQTDNLSVLAHTTPKLTSETYYENLHDEPYIAWLEVHECPTCNDDYYYENGC
jgi:hypothetical protein